MYDSQVHNSQNINISAALTKCICLGIRASTRILKTLVNSSKFVLSFYRSKHGVQTPREEIAFTAWPKVQSQSQIFRHGGSIFCLPHQPNLSDIFDLCLHWVSVGPKHPYLPKRDKSYLTKCIRIESASNKCL